MKELTYTSDEQIVADAAKKLLESHLCWSGCFGTLPSRDIDGVRGELIFAYRKATIPFAMLGSMSADQRDENWEEIGHHARLLFEKAAFLADRKWIAAMTLLGIEQ